MSKQSFPRIIFLSAVLAAAMLVANFAGATTSAIDNALNKSLQEGRELAKSMGHAIAEENAHIVSQKNKACPAVGINLDEADADKAATFKDVQATGNLKEDKY